MKGFIIFSRKNGNLVYSKYFNLAGDLSKEVTFQNLVFDGQDPSKIATQFYQLFKMTEIMMEEYKDEYPEDF